MGALRAAHVGVSVINNPELEDSVQRRVQGGEAGAGGRKKGLKAGGQQERVMRAMAEMQMQDLDPT